MFAVLFLSMWLNIIFLFHFGIQTDCTQSVSKHCEVIVRNKNDDADNYGDNGTNMFSPIALYNKLYSIYVLCMYQFVNYLYDMNVGYAHNSPTQTSYRALCYEGTWNNIAPSQPPHL